MPNFKSHIIKVLSYLPVNYVFSLFYSGKGSILFMHKVVLSKKKKERIELMDANEIDIVFLEKMIIHLKSKYDIISLNEVSNRLESSYKQKRNFITITFDDGYKDNLMLAYPILKKHDVPFTLYITNSFPNHTAKLWWYMLEDIVLENKEVRLFYSKKRYNYKTNSIKEKNKCFLLIREILINANKTDLDKALKTLEKSYNKSLKTYIEKEALNWDEIRVLSNDPLVTIGCHTVNHLALKTLSKEELIKEVIISRDELKEKTEQEINHFAYPFGTINEVGEKEIGIVNNLNLFKTATTTRMGNVFSSHKNFKNSLPRIQVLGNQQDLSILDMYLSGFLPALKNKFRRFITV